MSLSPQLIKSLRCLAEWQKRTGQLRAYNKTVTRFNLGEPLAGYGTELDITKKVFGEFQKELL